MSRIWAGRDPRKRDVSNRSSHWQPYSNRPLAKGSTAERAEGAERTARAKDATHAKGLQQVSATKGDPITAMGRIERIAHFAPSTVNPCKKTSGCFVRGSIPRSFIHSTCRCNSLSSLRCDVAWLRVLRVLCGQSTPAG